MQFFATLSSLLLGGFFALPAVNAGLLHSHPHNNNNTLSITAIVGKNNISTLECWTLTPGFTALDSRVSIVYSPGAAYKLTTLNPFFRTLYSRSAISPAGLS